MQGALPESQDTNKLSVGRVFNCSIMATKLWMDGREFYSRSLSRKQWTSCFSSCLWFIDQASFNRNEIFNYHKNHVWIENNPHIIVQDCLSSTQILELKILFFLLFCSSKFPIIYITRRLLSIKQLIGWLIEKDQWLGHRIRQI